MSIDKQTTLVHLKCMTVRYINCSFIYGSTNDSKLSIQILEDYGTDNQTLKHTVTKQILFGRINIRFGFMDWVAEYTVITVHPEWNMIFFVGEDGTIINMTWTA